MLKASLLLRIQFIWPISAEIGGSLDVILTYRADTTIDQAASDEGVKGACGVVATYPGEAWFSLSPPALRQTRRRRLRRWPPVSAGVVGRTVEILRQHVDAVSVIAIRGCPPRAIAVSHLILNDTRRIPNRNRRSSYIVVGGVREARKTAHLDTVDAAAPVGVEGCHAGRKNSAWPAPIEALAGKAAVQRLFEGKPNCHPLKLTADVPVLKSSTHSRLVSAFCGSYMISLRMISARRGKLTKHTAPARTNEIILLRRVNRFCSCQLTVSTASLAMMIIPNCKYTPAAGSGTAVATEALPGKFCPKPGIDWPNLLASRRILAVH